MAKKFKLNLENVPYEIEYKDNMVVVNGQEFPFNVSGNTITVNGTPHTVDVRGASATIDGIAYPFEAQGLEEPKASRKKAASASAGDEAGAVTAIMPGLIIKVLKAEGDKVTEGEVVVILEAMKMQNELQAKKSGTIKSISVKEGDRVEIRQVLMVIE